MSNCCGGLSLERWREMVGYSPYHFWQLSNSKVPVNSSCNALVREYEWQNADAAGRMEIRDAIHSAVRKLTDYLDYSPYPRYFEDVIPLFHTNFGAGCVTARLSVGRVIAFGVESFELIDTPDVTAEPKDLYTSGVNDAWEASFDGTEYDLENTFIYPAEADLPALRRATALHTPDCRWLFQARRYEVDAGRVTVQARLGEAVKPRKWELPTQVGQTALDPADATNFIDAPRFYTRATNSDGVTTATATVIFEYDNPCGCGACSCDGQGLPYSRLGQAVISDARTGEIIVYPATYNAEAETWTRGEFCGCGLPDRVRVRYYAGGDNACDWDEIVTRLAVAELARPICGCQSANRELHRWQTDLALSGGNNDEAYLMSVGDLDNPFGTRRGQVEAWKAVKRLALLRGFAF